MEREETSSSRAKLEVMATINAFVPVCLCQVSPCELIIKTRVGAVVALGKY